MFLINSIVSTVSHLFILTSSMSHYRGLTEFQTCKTALNNTKCTFKRQLHNLSKLWDHQDFKKYYMLMCLFAYNNTVKTVILLNIITI